MTLWANHPFSKRCMRRPKGWKGTGPYAEPEADDVESAVRAQLEARGEG